MDESLQAALLLVSISNVNELKRFVTAIKVLTVTPTWSDVKARLIEEYQTELISETSPDSSQIGQFGIPREMITTRGDASYVP